MRKVLPAMLETRRLLLRPPVMEDAPAITRCLEDSRVAWMSASIPHPEGRAGEWITRAHQAWVEGRIATFVVCLRSGRELAGVISLFPGATAEVGYWYHASHWGHGYATEALRRVLEYGLEDLGLEQVDGFHSAHNPASGCVMRKAGMLFRGASTGGARDSGTVYDTLHYGISAEEWYAGVHLKSA